jgi:transcriptional regulator with XRE-family HTH domain
MEFQSETLGNIVKNARIERRISQESLSEKVGVTPTHIKHIESGHRKPSLDVFFRLVTTLNISMDDLFFPKCSDKSELCQKAERLLTECSDYQLKIINATLEAMLFSE